MNAHTGVLIVLLLGCAVIVSSCERPPAPPKGPEPLKSFRVEWEDPNVPFDPSTMYSGSQTLLLRSRAAGTGELLLSYVYFDYHDPATVSQAQIQRVFKYSPKSNDLEAVDVSLWEAATGEVCACDYQDFDDAIPSFEFGPAKFKGKRIAQAGRHFCAATGSPNLPYVALQSADGKKEGLAIHFMGSATPTGPYYLQIFSKVDGRQVGETIPLPFTKDTDWTRLCWSPDGRYIVIYEAPWFGTIWIVETGLPVGGESGAGDSK